MVDEEKAIRNNFSVATTEFKSLGTKAAMGSIKRVEEMETNLHLAEEPVPTPMDEL